MSASLAEVGQVDTEAHELLDHAHVSDVPLTALYPVPMTIAPGASAGQADGLDHHRPVTAHAPHLAI